MNETQTMTVTVPHGARPGDTFRIKWGVDIEINAPIAEPEIDTVREVTFEEFLDLEDRVSELEEDFDDDEVEVSYPTSVRDGDFFVFHGGFMADAPSLFDEEEEIPFTHSCSADAAFRKQKTCKEVADEIIERCGLLTPLGRQLILDVLTEKGRYKPWKDAVNHNVRSAEIVAEALTNR